MLCQCHQRASYWVQMMYAVTATWFTVSAPPDACNVTVQVAAPLGYDAFICERVIALVLLIGTTWPPPPSMIVPPGQEAVTSNVAFWASAGLFCVLLTI
jgi:hypothetical protein